METKLFHPKLNLIKYHRQKIFNHVLFQPNPLILILSLDPPIGNCENGGGGGGRGVGGLMCLEFRWSDLDKRITHGLGSQKRLMLGAGKAIELRPAEAQ